MIPSCQPSTRPTIQPTGQPTAVPSVYAAEIDSISVLYKFVDESVGVASAEATVVYITVPEAGTRVHCAGYLVVDGVASSAPTSVYEVVQRGASATVPVGSKVVVVTLTNLFAASDYK